MKKLPIIGLLCASVVAVVTEKAVAHSVQTDYLLSPENGLALDVTFSTGEPLAEAPVKIYSPNNLEEPWFEGKTDKNGQFNFQPDQAMDGEWTVEIGELSHADILSVPVEKNEIQIDEISHGFSETLVAQNPLSLKALPAQATSLGAEAPQGFELDLILVGAAGVGGTILGRQWLTKKS